MILRGFYTFWQMAFSVMLLLGCIGISWLVCGSSPPARIGFFVVQPIVFSEVRLESCYLLIKDIPLAL